MTDKKLLGLISNTVLEESWIHYSYEEDLYVENSDEVAQKIIDNLTKNGYNITYTKPAPKWKCPLGLKDCTENCGSYGCGN
jgi:hypothetical protein